LLLAVAVVHLRMEQHRTAGAVVVLRIHQEQEALGRRDTMVEIATTREQEAVVWGLRVKVP
jgi:hypothetical protein